MTHDKKCESVDMGMAMLDPGAVFASPDALLARTDLSRKEKIEILQRWEYDASEEAVATEEGMGGGNGDLLQRVLVALDRLKADIDVDRVAPSKQHGIPSRAVPPADVQD